MTRQRRILLTNDDGIDSIGLHLLARAMCEHGDVVVVAPDREFSGAGAAVGALHIMQPEVHRVRVEGVAEAWTVNGPPALCVMFARLGAFGAAFDLVVSGVNPGANVGRAVYHSGTVGAALTARNGGISGVAVSQAVAGVGVEGQGWDEMLIGQRWDTAVHVASVFVASMIDDLPREPVVVNLNVPNVGVEEIKGWRHARVGHEPGRKMASATLEPIEGREGAFSVHTAWGDPVALPADTDGGMVDNDEVAVTYLSRLTAEQRTDLGGPENALTALLAR